MPSFPRLGKHSNRSQNALAEPHPIAVATTGAGTGGGGGPAAAAANSTSNSKHQSQLESPANNPHTPHSALSSTTAFSSSESSFVDGRSPQQQLSPSGVGGGAPLPPQHQHQHQLQQQHQHPQFYNSSEAPAADSPAFDAPSRGPAYPDPAVNRSQSQRYSTYAVLPHQQNLRQVQQQQLYGIGSSSLDDLPSTSGYPGSNEHQPQQQQQQQQQQAPTPTPEKKSRRQLIKGIFSSSTKHDHNQQDQHHQQNQLHKQRREQQQQQQQLQPQAQGTSHTHQDSYGNSTGPPRRSSKRVSSPPNINTRFSQTNQYVENRDWQGQEAYSVDSSPLQPGQAPAEYQYRASESERGIPVQDAQAPLHNTIRPVPNNELDTSPYEGEAVYQQQPHQGEQPSVQPHRQHPSAPPLQPHVKLHLQEEDQNRRYEQAPYDQQIDEEHPLSPARDHSFTPTPLSQQGSDPRALTGHLGPNPQQLQNPETISQISHESPVTDSEPRPSTQQSAPSPAVNYPGRVSELASPVLPNAEVVVPPGPQGIMAPPPTGSSSNRRPQEGEKAVMRGSGDGSAGPPPGYRHSNNSVGALNALPSGNPPNPVFRADGTPRFDTPGLDQGRHSPQPMNPDREGGGDDKAVKDLLVKYKNVKRLYFDGKSQIENLHSQVEQLQNAVANQRMSQSRIALDDNEYLTRFNRLNGAINNLSFNIRKDWRSVPPWLEKYISPEALKTGKQEMTAVGRAIITRWIVEEIFNRCFHPGLEPLLSAQLKAIELSIRGNAYTMTSQEEYDALTTKVVNWRMATLDGLSKALNSPSAGENRHMFTDKVTTNLTACLYQYLSNPPPAGVEGSTSMIVELAVGLAANLPLESRDVAITYPLPGDMVQSHLMELEKTGLPVLDGYKSDEDDSDEETKSGMWTRKLSNAPPGPRKGSVASGHALGSTVTDAELQSAGSKETMKVRFAGFVAVEVRGRQVLLKAPVWPI